MQRKKFFAVSGQRKAENLGAKIILGAKLLNFMASNRPALQ